MDLVIIGQKIECYDGNFHKINLACERTKLIRINYGGLIKKIDQATCAVTEQSNT